MFDELSDDSPTHEASGPALVWSGGLLDLSHRHGPDCGRSRTSESSYFPDWDDVVAVATHRYHGVSYACCGQFWSSIATYRGGCGEPLGMASARAPPVRVEDLHRYADLLDPGASLDPVPDPAAVTR